MTPPTDYDPAMGKSGKERMRELRERRAQAGLIQVVAWVPRSKAGRLQRYAAKLRSEPPEATD
jgi:hypothetical protein